ncbi:hypothetical protein HDU96_006864 [Phlyctochytrium bullatum]|nr:hypothetical protein HDU96_006864 [Phlyctochytrium bullatum]
MNPMATAELAFTTFRGLTLRAKTFGLPPSTAPPTATRILAIHGWLDNASTFDLLIPRIFPAGAASKEFSVVSLDMAGHGRSDHRSKDADYTIPAYVEDTMAVVEQLGWDRFSLMGHSMGGAIVSVVAAILGERIENLIAIEALGPYIPRTPALSSITQFITTVRAQSLAPSTKRLFPTLEAATQARMNGLHKLTHPAATPLTIRGTHAVTRGRDRGHEWTSDPRLRLPSPIRLSPEDGHHIVKQIRARVLNVWADGESSESEHYMLEKRFGLVAKLLAVELPGGHHLHLEPETVGAVAEVVKKFLDGRGWDTINGAKVLRDTLSKGGSADGAVMEAKL